MPFSYDRDSGEFILALSDFSGMLNSRDIDSVLRDDELSGVRNFTRDRLGALKVRNGFTRINQIKIDNNPIKAVGGYYKVDGTRETIATSGTSIYKRSTGAFSAIKTGLTGSGKKFCFHQFMDYYYMSNGTDKIQVMTAAVCGI